MPVRDFVRREVVRPAPGHDAEDHAKRGIARPSTVTAFSPGSTGIDLDAFITKDRRRSQFRKSESKHFTSVCDWFADSMSAFQ